MLISHLLFVTFLFLILWLLDLFVVAVHNAGTEWDLFTNRMTGKELIVAWIAITIIAESAVWATIGIQILFQ